MLAGRLVCIALGGRKVGSPSSRAREFGGALGFRETTRKKLVRGRALCAVGNYKEKGGKGNAQEGRSGRDRLAHADAVGNRGRALDVGGNRGRR